MPANDNILDAAMRAAWINAGYATTREMPGESGDATRADAAAVLAALDARILVTGGHARRARQQSARDALVSAMDAMPADDAAPAAKPFSAYLDSPRLAHRVHADNLAPIHGTAAIVHEPASDDAAPVVTDAEMAPYRVSRQHSGSEDGYLYYVVDADGSRVDGAGHVYAESARADAADYARLAALPSTYHQRAVTALRSQCYAPSMSGLAVLDASGEIVEYRIVDARNADTLSPADMLTMALDDYAGEPVSIVTDAGTFHEPGSAPLPSHIADMLARGWHVVYVDAAPSLMGARYSATFENAAGVRTARHVRADTASTLRGMLAPDAAAAMRHEPARDGVVIDAHTSNRLRELAQSDALARVDSIALDIAEIGAGESSADARDAYRRRIADLRRELAALPLDVLADVPTGTLEMAGGSLVVLATIAARLVHDGSPVPALTIENAMSVLAYARDFASDCMWQDADADSIACMHPGDVVRCAAGHYDGGMAALVRDALAS